VDHDPFGRQTEEGRACLDRLRRAARGGPPDAALLAEALEGWGGCLNRLAAAEEQIRQLNAELERRVRERTEQLEAVNRQNEELLRSEQEAQRQLREADRHKDEFLAILAHELRNPLAPILNTLHTLNQTSAQDPDSVQRRQILERQVRRIARLVDDLMDVSRISRGKVELRKERVDLAAVITRAVESTRPLLEARAHRLELALPPKPVWLEADPDRLEQVLANLLTNAAKYTEPGGQVRVLAEPEGGEVVLRVRDTGIGLAPEMLPRVFELFTQANPSPQGQQGGLGIGLTLVRSLVEMHGGTVQALSDGPGSGCEFVVRLPAAAAAAPRPDPAGTVPSQPMHRTLRVLLVDDHRDTAESLAMLLRLTGHEVSLAHDSPAAMQVARVFQPEAVLLDMELPGADGYQVGRQLRRLAGLERVLLVGITGQDGEEEQGRAGEAGFDHFLVKPVDLAALEALLARANAPGL
jgi:signal transduction histidine kinase